jgi:polyisoprenoid-binding protein YceI
MHGAALVALLALVTAPQPVPSHLWHIESARSHVDFDVRLLWLHRIRGRFEHVTGAVQPRADGRVVVNAGIAADSLTMNSPRLRHWVLDEEFFDAARYPTLRFVSLPLSRTTLEGGGTLDGRLTLRGITRPVRFQLLPARCTADACTIEARGQLQRHDFGMGSHHTVLSDRVELALSIAIVRAPG